MLSDHEQRALAELERCCALEALEPDPPCRWVGRPGPSQSAAVTLGPPRAEWTAASAGGVDPAVPPVAVGGAVMVPDLLPAVRAPLGAISVATRQAGTPWE